MASLIGQPLQRQRLIQPGQLAFQPAQLGLPVTRRQIQQQIGKDWLRLLQQSGPVAQLRQRRQARLLDEQLLMVLPMGQRVAKYRQQSIGHRHAFLNRHKAHALHLGLRRQPRQPIAPLRLGDATQAQTAEVQQLGRQGKQAFGLAAD